MQEPAELGPSSEVVEAAVFSAPALTLISLALLGLTRYQVDPNGGILAIIAALIARVRAGFTDADVGLAQDPKREEKGAFISQARLFDCLWIKQAPVVIASIILSRYNYWSFALALGIYRTLLQVS